MTAILGADTLSPSTDRATRFLAEYLRDSINADWLRIRGAVTPDLGDRAVIGIREYDAFNFVSEDFPALVVYRTGSRGEGLGDSNAVAAYYLPSLAEQERQPGIMRWIETRIARALERLGMAFDDAQPVVVDMAGARSEYQIGLLPGSNIPFPYLKIFFDFTEIGA
jgi:hypothetical protein